MTLERRLLHQRWIWLFVGFASICDAQLLGVENLDPWRGYLGSICLGTNPACVVPNSECKENICHCKDGYKPSNGFCIGINIGCPGGRIPFLTEPERLPLRCTIAPDTCPSGYACARSTISHDDICCAEYVGHCPEGSLPYLEHQSGQIMPCSPRIACPTGYQCLQHNGRLTCCSNTKQVSICPVPKNPAKDREGNYIYCSGGAHGSCPAGYECYFHDGIYICCTAGGINAYTCPTGKSPLIDKETGEIQRCLLSEADSCPPGYSCEYSGKGYLCCSAPMFPNFGRSSEAPNFSAEDSDFSSESPYFSSHAIAAAAEAQRSPAAISLSMSPDLPIIKEAMRYICPMSTFPLLSELTNSTVECDDEYRLCPTGFTCDDLLHVCCSIPPMKQIADADICPPGRAVYRGSVSHLPQACSPHDAASCPAGFQCFFYLTAFVCCSSQVKLECPSGGNAMTDARNNLIFCDISGRRGQICPSSYACLETGVGEVCCPKGEAGGNSGGGLNAEPNSSEMKPKSYPGCPAKWDPYLDPFTRKAQPCGAGMPCPTGYECMERKGIGICCIADYATHYCPKTMSPYITNENMILSCDPGLENVCPTLFKCLFSTTLKSHVCCTPIAANEQIPRQSLASYGLPRTEVAAVNLCPNSSEILKNPMGLPQSCQSTDSGEECPPRYLCYYPYFTVPLGFCCSIRDADAMGICPRSRPALMSSLSNGPLTCTPNNNYHCPPLYGCVFSRHYASYFCCKEEGPTTARPSPLPPSPSVSPNQSPPLPMATATTVVKVEKWAGTLNHTCLPSSAAPEHRCLTPNTTCDLTTNTCVCRSKFIPYRGRCMSEVETNNYLQTLLIGTLTPIGGVVNEAYDRMQTVLNRWLPAESRLRDSVNSIDKMSFAERRFWNTIKRAILEYFCNCTIPDGYEAILDAVDAIRITESFRPGDRNLSHFEPESFYEIMPTTTLPPRAEIDKTIGKIVDSAANNELKSLNLTDGDGDPTPAHFEVLVEEVPAVDKPRT